MKKVKKACSLCGSTKSVSDVNPCPCQGDGDSQIKVCEGDEVMSFEEPTICDDCLHANFSQCTICKTHFRNEEFSYLHKQCGKPFANRCLFCSPMDFIESCTNLQELCDTLNFVSELKVNQQLINYASLPTFNSNVPVPQNTSEVFSWDDNRCLVIVQDWEIIERCPKCGEASFHCKCP